MKILNIATLIALTTISLTIKTDPTQNNAPARPTTPSPFKPISLFLPLPSLEKNELVTFQLHSINQDINLHSQRIMQGSLGKNFAILFKSVYNYQDADKRMALLYLEDARNKVKSAAAANTKEISDAITNFRSNIIIMYDDIVRTQRK